MNDDSNGSRREFLKFLAASPALLACPSAFSQVSANLYAPQRIARAADAVNVFDFHEVAKSVMTPAHYTYMAMGTENGEMLQVNRDGFRQVRLRVRRLTDTSSINTNIEIFGRRYPVPILIAPCGSQKGFHPDGEPAVKRAAESRQLQMMLSSVSSTSIEDINAIGAQPAWFQLYTSPEYDVSLARAKRAEAAGSEALVLTVDLPDSNREAQIRLRRDSTAECQVCHDPQTGSLPPKPMMGSHGIQTSHLDWAWVERLKRDIDMKLIIKGIVGGEDAELAVRHGADAAIVSNHGGRSEISGRSTIECLPEVVAAVDGRLPIICDSGFRRGTDIFKALALGADAIGIGRPYLWGLSAFGQEGVETVIDVLTRELEIVMRQAGTRSIAEIGPQYVV